MIQYRTLCITKSYSCVKRGTSDSHSEDTGSNPVGAAKNLSLIYRRERHKALISLADQSFFLVFTFQRLRALFPDETTTF